MKQYYYKEAGKMSKNKRYYWLKLKKTYFNQLEQKKMKRQPEGRNMQIIYLRMLLLCIDTDGFIFYQGVYDTIEEELAEEFDEPVELIQQTVNFLLSNNMVSTSEDNSLYMPEAVKCVGSESDSAERVRKHRETEKMLQCNANVTECNTEKEIEIEKEIEKEPEIEGENRIDYQEIVNLYNDTCVSFPKVLALSEARKKAIKARLKIYSLEDFKKLFQMAEGSRFLKGGNDRNWSANFDWLIKDSNMAKVLEGNYEDKPNNKPKQTSTGNIFLDMLQEEEEKTKNEQNGND